MILGFLWLLVVFIAAQCWCNIQHGPCSLSAVSTRGSDQGIRLGGLVLTALYSSSFQSAVQVIFGVEAIIYKP